MAKKTFRTNDHFLFRTPLLPARAFYDWSQQPQSASAIDSDDLSRVMQDDCAGLRQRLREIVNRPEVREAVFICSPDLDESFDEWLKEPDSPRGQKVERALVRYFTRMTYRCTPFGLCSGVSVGSVGDKTEIRVSELSTYESHARIDNDYLFALTLDLEKEPTVRSRLRYFPNSSLYEAAGKIRYAEARLVDRSRTYHLVAVDKSDFVDAAIELARSGTTVDALVACVLKTDEDDEITSEEAFEFVNELIDSQILVSRFSPVVTGRQPIEGVLDGIEKWAKDLPANRVMKQVDSKVRALCGPGLGNLPQAYRDIAEELKELSPPVTLSRLFQVDMVKPVQDAKLGGRVLQEVERGISILATLTRPSSPNSRIADFCKEFSARWEQQEVPLLEALDEEVGIGFAKSNSASAEAAPLLAGLPLGGAAARTTTATLTHQDGFLIHKLSEILASGATELELSKQDIETLKHPEGNKLCHSFSTMTKVLAASLEDAERGNFQVVLNSASGPSGERISGRFCHTSKELEAGVKAALRTEESMQPHAVFAEVVHLPQGRMGNILSRPVLRDYEIVYLGESEAAEDQLIPVQDLMVSVRGEQVYLRSKRLNKQVIPRMTTAHNFQGGSLGVYHFLCALQSQDSGYANWSWGVCDNFPFLPRVTHGRLIFAPARWRVNGDELKPIADATKGSKSAKTPEQIQGIRERIFVAVQKLRANRKLPRHVVQVDSDNTLLVDLDNPLSVESWGWLVKGRGNVELEECLVHPDSVWLEGPEGKFAHELVVSFSGTEEPAASAPVFTTQTRESSQQSGVRSDFYPGSEWLYFKAYTGTSTADDVLSHAVMPVMRDAVASGAVDSWFFLRYGDPDWHLRLRAHGDPARLTSEVLPRLAEIVDPMVQRGAVHRTVLDTYKREIDRYHGVFGIELAEKIWHADSDAVATIVSLLEGDDGAEARWRLSVRGCDQLLRDFGLTLEEKIALMRKYTDYLLKEQGGGKTQQKIIGTKFRAENEWLSLLLGYNEAAEREHDYWPGFEALYQRSEIIKPYCDELRSLRDAGKLNGRWDDAVWSYLHMHCNRLLRSAARAQELVIYSFLKRWYEMERARSMPKKDKKKKKSKKAAPANS